MGVTEEAGELIWSCDCEDLRDEHKFSTCTSLDSGHESTSLWINAYSKGSWFDRLFHPRLLAQVDMILRLKSIRKSME